MNRPRQIKRSLVATFISEHVSFSDKWPLLKMLELFEISHCSYQPFNVLPYLRMNLLDGFSHISLFFNAFVILVSLINYLIIANKLISN